MHWDGTRFYIYNKINLNVYSFTLRVLFFVRSAVQASSKTHPQNIFGITIFHAALHTIYDTYLLDKCKEFEYIYVHLRDEPAFPFFSSHIDKGERKVFHRVRPRRYSFVQYNNGLSRVYK